MRAFLWRFEPLKLWFDPRSWRGVLDTTLCDKVCQWLAIGPWFSPGTPVSSTNITDRYDIAEILLKVALNTITKSKPMTIVVSISSSTTCRQFSCRSFVVDLIIARSYNVFPLTPYYVCVFCIVVCAYAKFRLNKCFSYIVDVYLLVE